MKILHDSHLNAFTKKQLRI